jgi:Xaa-Pro dipeptidase
VVRVEFSRASKLGRLKQSMADHQIDAIISLKPENSFYLSGFNPIIYSHPVIAILPTRGEPALLIHALRDDHSRQSTLIRDIRLYGSWGKKKTMGPDWLAALAEICREMGLEDATIGLELDFISVSRLEAFRSTFPGVKFTNASPLIEHARYVKDANEIALARKASAIADRGMSAAIGALRAGGTERDVSIEAMRAMNQYWASELPDIEVCDFGSLEGGVHNGLWCWALFGERVLFNADNPTNRRPRLGEIELILIWTVANGIHAENERAVAVGELSKEKRQAYDSVLTIRERVQEKLKPGTAVKDVYACAREQYEALGYAGYIPGRIGHGIGLGPHEHLSIDANSKFILEPGMIITFEPSIRIPEWGGLQHSDTTLITDTGFEFLTTAERGYIQV